jgi:Mg-chelatase subunit ChlD
VKELMEDSLLENKVAVISCDDDTDVIPASARNSPNMVKTMRSGRSGLGVGLSLALKLSEDGLKNGIADNVVMVVITDGSSHSENDADLMSSAAALNWKSKELCAAGFKLKSVIIDTSADGVQGEAEWTEGGMRLARASGAEYYQVPELTDMALSR